MSRTLWELAQELRRGLVAGKDERSLEVIEEFERWAREKAKDWNARAKELRHPDAMGTRGAYLMCADDLGVPEDK